jgi:hypothetical protein
VRPTEEPGQGGLSDPRKQRLKAKAGDALFPAAAAQRCTIRRSIASASRPDTRRYSCSSPLAYTICNTSAANMELSTIMVQRVARGATSRAAVNVVLTHSPRQ